MNELEYFDDYTDFDDDDVSYESYDNHELHESSDLELDSKNTSKGQYVNEHRLAVLMSMFKNWDGHAPKSIAFREDFKEARAMFESAKSEYDRHLEEGVDKRSKLIQTPFMQMLEYSTKCYPTDREIAELYGMIALISNRCVSLYAKNKGVEVDDIVGNTFERWIRYRHSFDPLKRSEISGVRVNAFAYMTQMIKNSIFEATNKIKKQKQLEEKLIEEMSLRESLNTISTYTVSDDVLNLSKGTLFNVSDDIDEHEDNDIIKCLVKRVTRHSNLKNLIMDVELDGFKREKIINVICNYNLQNALEDVIHKNVWDF